MAFKDRVVQYPNRFLLTDGEGNTTGPYTLTRDEGTIEEAGTLLNANNLNNPDITSLSIGGQQIADWVTEQGTNGSWKYRKWHSGKVEAWTRWEVGTVAITTASPTFGGYRSGELTLTIPSGIFTSAPFTVAEKTYSMGGWLSHIRSSSATSITAYYGAGASTTINNQTIDVYAWEN